MLNIFLFIKIYNSVKWFQITNEKVDLLRIQSAFI